MSLLICNRKTRLEKLFFGMVLITLLLTAAGCGRLPGTSQTHNVPGGDADRGREALSEYGCHSCHRIPGVRRADAMVAPPLDVWAERRYIAGRFPNTPDNLINWIMDPQSMNPGTAMPTMDVSEQDARDMSAYLYSLQRGR
jgi:cytochrome c